MSSRMTVSFLTQRTLDHGASAKPLSSGKLGFPATKYDRAAFKSGPKRNLISKRRLESNGSDFVVVKLVDVVNSCLGIIAFFRVHPPNVHNPIRPTILNTVDFRKGCQLSIRTNYYEKYQRKLRGNGGEEENIMNPTNTTK
eukprot:CAMPEP_0119138898 /NCGR_PEP_ID=MMETSP1310-20130426/26542_1 /TAXON_ID=464262 /ORGANISM="Genus nov. species nov., Strain RCC2339" /LENGTH=140 /DNA_ID=CAMNT_0007130135 /DNA_START=277 /DNA_END=699 /DNA_ORIENTATION=+